MQPSLTELTARAGNLRNETQRLAFDDWLTGLAEAWQSTQPDGEIHLTLAPALRSSTQTCSLDGAIQSLLLPARRTRAPPWRSTRKGGSGGPPAHPQERRLPASSSATDDHPAQQAAIEALGGRLSIQSWAAGREA